MPPQVATETNVGDDILDDAAPAAPVLPTEPPPIGDEAGLEAGQPSHQETAAVEQALPADEPAFPSADDEAQELRSVPAETAAAAVEDPVGSTDRSRRSVRQRLRARQLRARKVRRTIRHIDPWSVLKFSVFFFALAWMVVIMAGVALWSLAVNSGLVTDFEDLVIELFDLTSFSVDPNLLFRVSVLIGGAMALGGALFMGVLAVLFNLLSDLLGGIRVSVIEEETARRIVE
jgi:hypothetical protein